MDTGRRTATSYGALDAFFPAVLALSGDLERARRLQASSFKMWTRPGIEPDSFDYRTMKVDERRLPAAPRDRRVRLLPPSSHAATRDTCAMGADDVRRLRQALPDRRRLRRAQERRDEGEGRTACESFLFAETFKYFYLLFAPPRTLDFDRVVFNTEAHPIRKTW